MKQGAIRLRAAQEEDLPRLKELWREAFDEDLIGTHQFETCFVPDQVQSSLVLLEDDVIRSMAFFLPTFWYDTEKGYSPAPCLVGLATDRTRCHRKYASWLVETACDFMVEKGAGGVWTLLQDDALEIFFSMQGFWTMPDAGLQTFAAAELPGGAEICRTQPAEYDRVRERLLHGCNHVVMGPVVTAWQRELAERGSGGMFLARVGGEEACVLATVCGDTVHVHEILCADEKRPVVLGAVAQALGGKKCVVHRPFGMLRLMNRFAEMERPQGYLGCGIMI